MFDHNHRVALVDEPVQHAEELSHILEVQAGGRLIEDVDGVTGGALGQLTSQLDPLGLASRQGGRRLAETHVPQAHVDQRLHVAGDRWLVLEERERLAARHVQHVGDGAPLKADVEGVAVVPLPLADLARHVHVGQEVHLYANRPVTGARLASAALHIETEPSGLVAADPRLLGLGEQFPDVVEHTGVGGGVGSWGPSDRRLVDVDDLVDGLDAVQGGM